jgi:protein-disulfide isomerase
MKKIILAFFLLFSINAGHLHAQSGGDIVAVVNGRQISQQEIDESIAGQLAPLQKQISILRKAALDNYILKTILEQEAGKRGISVDELRTILTSIRVEVPRSEIEKEYLENASAFALMSPDEAKERLRLDMETHARIRHFKAELQKLQAQSKINILKQFVAQERVAVDSAGPSIGRRDARVTVVMFSDFQCPYCRQASEVIKKILGTYPEDVRLVYKHLPLDIHSDALPAARASVCAGRQGKFWEYHDVLFASADLSEKELEKTAEKLNLDKLEFRTCMNSESSRLEIVKDLREAKRLKIDGTPAFYINGIPIAGAVPFEKLSQIITEEIMAKNK